MPKDSLEQKEHDQRILGNREFLVEVKRMNADLKIGALRMPHRGSGGTGRWDLRISYLAVRVIGWNGAELARALRMTRSGVSEAAERGNLLVRKNPH